MESAESWHIPNEILSNSYITYYLFITGRPARSEAMPVLFLLSSPKIGFSPLQGRHVAPINVKFGTRPLPRAKFYVYRGRNLGIQPPKLAKFRILPI